MPFASTVGLGVSTFIDTDLLDDRKRAIDMTDDELAAIVAKARLTVTWSG